MEAIKLVETYKAVLNTNNGNEVLQDLRNLCGINEQAGSQLSHSECAYKNGMQDMFRYIEAMVSKDD
tara:strand:+ start:11830 stop:12030 length:201 start_codon:yes stop_codon:yes gene_type:complete